MLVFFTLSILYTLLICSFYWGWLKTPSNNEISNNINLPVSIVIAARNEAQNIANLLKCLLAQTYNKQCFEIIVVNDHSDDNTAQIIKKYSHYCNAIKFLHLSSNQTGKKAALFAGVQAATHNLIITIDSDCTVSANWLATIACYYTKYNPQLIICPVLYNNKSVFEQLQALEFSSLIASTAGAAGIGYPIMCNGANLAFTKQVYFETFNLHNSINSPSGDDMFLLQAIHKKYKHGIRFLKSVNAVAYTNAAPNIKQFTMQRKRWASKSKLYTSWHILASAAIVFMFSFLIVLLFALSFYNKIYLLPFLLLLILKLLIDFPLLNSFTVFFNQQKLMKWFLPLQLIYPFYITFTALIGLMGSFRWKGRKY